VGFTETNRSAPYDVDECRIPFGVVGDTDTASKTESPDKTSQAFEMKDFSFGMENPTS
jgi:hypothetical protein